MQYNDNTKFFDLVYQKYSDTKYPDTLEKEVLSPAKLVYYLADKKGGILKIENEDIWEIDIHAAYPSICRHLFPEDSDFIRGLNEQTDKLSRNKYISVRLKESHWIKQLGLISKMIILSCASYGQQDNFNLLELKKDGLSFIGRMPDLDDGLFRYYQNLGFEFRLTKYRNYVRYSKTSVYMDANTEEITYKGTLKDRPPYLLDVVKKYWTTGTLDKKNIRKYYSWNWWEIVHQNLLDELFLQYYMCTNGMYFGKNRRYMKPEILSKCELDPTIYLQTFLYPLI